jgi:hypothetical protein
MRRNSGMTWVRSLRLRAMERRASYVGMPLSPRLPVHDGVQNVVTARRGPDESSSDAQPSSTLPPTCSNLAQDKGVLVTDIGQALLDAIADLKADMDRRFTAVDRHFDAVDARFNAVDARFDAVDARFNAVDEKLAVLPPMRAHLDGLPLINRAVTVLQQDSRSLKAAFNDFAATNMTVGEIQALHDDVNRVQAENADLAVKVATLQRLVSELQERVAPVLAPR